MKIDWFWKWFEKVLKKSDQKRRIIVRIIEFLNRKKIKARKEDYERLRNLYYTAKKGLTKRAFEVWVENAFFNLVGKVDEVQLEIMEKALSIMKD